MVSQFGGYPAFKTKLIHSSAQPSPGNLGWTIGLWLWAILDCLRQACAEEAIYFVLLGICFAQKHILQSDCIMQNRIRIYEASHGRAFTLALTVVCDVNSTKQQQHRESNARSTLYVLMMCHGPSR